MSEQKPVNLNEVDLMDMVPKEAAVLLRETPESPLEEFALRPFTLRDEAWMADQFGSKTQAIFQNLEMEPICRLIYHQLKPEDKRRFKPVETLDYDEDGNEMSVVLKPLERIMQGIKGKRHQIAVVESLLQTIGWSQPILSDEERKALVDEDKKKGTPKKKARRKSKPQTGQKSSTL